MSYDICYNEQFVQRSKLNQFDQDVKRNSIKTNLKKNYRGIYFLLQTRYFPWKFCESLKLLNFAYNKFRFKNA